MNCALIEFNHVHDQILPTQVYLLNRLGIRPDVYMAAQAIRNDAFVYAEGLEYRRLRTDGWWWRIRGTPSRLARYDLVVANSIEPLGVLGRVAAIGLPTVGVLHNADLIYEPIYADYFRGRGRVPLVLAKHVASSLSPVGAVEWIAPVYLGEPAPRTRADHRWRFCVSGNIEFSRRNYAALLHAVADLSLERSDFVVTCLGRADWDGPAFRAQIADAGLERFFEFSESEISYGRYFSEAAGADFLLPLLDTSSCVFAPYFRTKVNSSLLMAVALGVVPVVHSAFARLYGLGPDTAILYEDDPLVDAMRRALDERPERSSQLRENLIAKRESVLAESVDRMDRAIAATGAGR
jgi:hypothetical protein